MHGYAAGPAVGQPDAMGLFGRTTVRCGWWGALVSRGQYGGGGKR